MGVEISSGPLHDLAVADQAYSYTFSRQSSLDLTLGRQSGQDHDRMH
jgi:hypothetical protein